MRRWLVLLVALEGAAGAGDDKGVKVDVSVYKDRIVAYSDDKGRYIMFNKHPLRDMEKQTFESESFFYGDGKTMYELLRQADERQADEVVTFWFFDARFEERTKIIVNGATAVAQCNEREASFTRVADAETKKLVDGARFEVPRFRFVPVVLARDNTGTYYYVDRPLYPANTKRYRVWRGMKGKLKQQKMKNVVDDSDGKIFITKQGKLRLIVNNEGTESSWIKGKKEITLTVLDWTKNLPLVYVELGVYAGAVYGTPCDEI